MARLSQRVGVGAFRALYVGFIVAASVETLLPAIAHRHATMGNSRLLPIDQGWLAGLAALEILAALLFLFRAMEIFSCALLLVVYASAQVLALLQGEFTLRFVFYAGTAMFVVFLSRTPVTVSAR